MKDEIFIYNEDTLKIIVDYINYQLELNNPPKNVFLELKEYCYIISPNPRNTSIQFLVFEDRGDNELCYFFKINKTKKIMKHLRKQYYNVNRDFRYFKPINEFLRDLDHYYEEKPTSENILLSDGYIYDFENLDFKKKVYEIPSTIINREYKELKESDEKILNKMFNLMYPSLNEQKKFFYYILCCLNRYYSQQKAFLIIDPSRVGKTAKIVPMEKLRLNKIANERLLEKSELYNIAYNNGIVFNESQLASLNGSTISSLVDTTDITVTKKNSDAMVLESEDKPLIQIMGESLPFFKSLNDGTQRRFLLVPKVDSKYIEFIKEENNEQIKKNFLIFFILNLFKLSFITLKKLKNLI